MFSGLSSFIYYPAILSLSTSLRTSVGLINLTVTSYLIVAGLAPSITGDLADTTGRRPLYLLTIGIYFLSNIGLALQRNYAALLVLRMVQSFGSSGEHLIF
jgi:MFS family permease